MISSSREAPPNVRQSETTPNAEEAHGDESFFAASTAPPRTPRSSSCTHDCRFSCNICLEPVSEPVSTSCGHLYCWPCLYRWLEPGMLPGERQSLTGTTGLYQPIDETRRVCPVCKAPCSVPTLIPIYVRNNDPSPNNKDGMDGAEEEGVRVGEAASRVARRHSSRADENVPGDRDQQDSQRSLQEFEEINTASTGLRQRLRFRSRDSVVSSASTDAESHGSVPARPQASSPSRQQLSPAPGSSSGLSTPQRNTGITPLSPHRASLSHGLALSFQQALVRASAVTTAASPGAQQQQQQQYFSQVPPLHHRREGVGGNAFYSLRQADPDATEFLSRILLILGSFVVLCLLLF